MTGLPASTCLVPGVSGNFRWLPVFLDVGSMNFIWTEQNSEQKKREFKATTSLNLKPQVWQFQRRHWTICIIAMLTTSWNIWKVWQFQIVTSWYKSAKYWRETRPRLAFLKNKNKATTITKRSKPIHYDWRQTVKCLVLLSDGGLLHRLHPVVQWT